MSPPAHDHFDLVMAEIRGLRAEIHEFRREDKSERVLLATKVDGLEEWRNKQAGALALIAALSGVLGAAIVKVFGLWLGAKGGGGS